MVGDAWPKLFPGRTAAATNGRDGAENLVLTSLVSATRDNSGPFDIGFRRKLPGFYGKLGLDHNNRRPRLKRIAEMAVDWFADHGGEFACRIGADWANFISRNRSSARKYATPKM